MEKDIYVVVAEFEVRKDNSDHMESRPIVFETHTDTATKENPCPNEFYETNKVENI